MFGNNSIKKVTIKAFTTRILLIALSISPFTSAAEDASNIPKPYEIYSETLSEGLTGGSEVICSKQQLQVYLDKGKCNEKLRAFLSDTDFATKSLLVYNLIHEGSGSDTPAFRARGFTEGVLQCEAYDANTSDIRTSDLKASEWHFAIRVQKSVVKYIDVIDTLSIASDYHIRKAQRKSRRFSSQPQPVHGLESACTVIQRFPAYRDLQPQNIAALTKLDLSYYCLSLYEYQAIRMLPKLEEAKLVSTGATGRKTEVLADHPTLTDLSFGDEWSWNCSAPFDDQSLEGLSNSKIKKLTIPATSISDKGLLMLRDMPRLEFLDIRRNKLTTEGLMQLAKIPGLHEIDLRGTPSTFVLERPDIVGIDPFMEGSKPEEKKFGLTPELFQALSELKQLQRLQLDLSPKELDACLPELKRLKALTHLNLDTREIQDRHLSEIALLENLVFLRFGSWPEITDAGLSVLKPLRKLESLSLGYATSLEGSGFAQLAHLPLRKLDMRSTKVRDQGLKTIAQSFPGLELLNLRSVETLTRDCIPTIQSMKELKYLNPPDELRLKGLRHLQVFYQDRPFLNKGWD